MKPTFAALVAGIVSIAAFNAHAQVAVTGAWVRATVPQQRATGAFMQLTAAQPTRLIGVQSSIAGTAEIHEMRMDNNHVMRMSAVTGIDLPAGKPVELKSGGYHIMLMDLKSQVKEGESIAMTLTFEGADKRRENMQIKVPVRALTSAPAAHKH